MGRYPSEPELKAIREWECRTWQDYRDFANYIISIWEYADMGYASLNGNTLRLSTAGWSGNEEILGDIQENKMFMMVCWYSSKRGGHYVFKLPSKKTFNRKQV